MTYAPVTPFVDTAFNPAFVEPTGVAIRQMIDVLAGLEQSLIAQGSRTGVKAAQRRRIKFGRKVDTDRRARKLIGQGRTPTDAAKLMAVSRTTLCCALRREAT